MKSSAFLRDEAMSYDQAMKHWKNHRKDKFFQPCSPNWTNESWTVSADMFDHLSQESMKKIVRTEHQYPIYLAQDKMGQWGVVPKNHFASVEIHSIEELFKFAEGYIDP